MKTYRGFPKKLKSNYILCFGANTQFRHGLGTALIAVKNWGAIYGKGGFQGNSYALVTKDLTKKTHPSVSIDFIVVQITELYKFAKSRPDLLFFVVYSGKGKNLNAYSNEQLGNMFFIAGEIPENMVFEENFAKLIK